MTRLFDCFCGTDTLLFWIYYCYICLKNLHHVVFLATNGHVDTCENPVYKIFQQAVLFNSDDLSEATNIRLVYM